MPDLPVVCWTASPAWHLPQMIREDPMTQVVDKAAGAIGFESALRRALANGGSRAACRKELEMSDLLPHPA